MPDEASYRVWIIDFVFASSNISAKEVMEMTTEEFNFKFKMALRNFGAQMQRKEVGKSFGV